MDPKKFVQSLKGSQGQVLLAFYFSRQSMEARDVQIYTGLTLRTVQITLEALAAKKLLVKEVLGNGRIVWSLAENLP
jgi:hypothetical protein